MRFLFATFIATDKKISNEKNLSSPFDCDEEITSNWEREREREKNSYHSGIPLLNFKVVVNTVY